MGNGVKLAESGGKQSDVHLDEKEMIKKIRINARGFTLVELMIAVVIIGILAALTAPTISRSMERSRYNDFNRALAAGLIEARMFAMNSGQAVFVRVDTANAGLIVYTPENFGLVDGQATSCSTAEGGGGVALANEILRVDASEFGLPPMVVTGIAGSNNDFCISPSGKFLTEQGQIIFNCREGDLNHLIWVQPQSATPARVNTCPQFDQDSKDLRQIDNASVIHLSYNGQVRVMQ